MVSLVVAQKLDSLRRCVQRLVDKTPTSAEALANDLDVQDILVLNLTRAVQLCVDIGSHLLSTTNEPAPTSMGETFDALQRCGLLSLETATAMRRAVGFRNIAVHNYEVINWEIVYAICQRQLGDFRRFAREVSAPPPLAN